MAVAKSAFVANIERLGAQGTWLELALPAGESLGFVGGQYIIVDTGVPADSQTGKPVKRAYSILSADSEQGRFALAIKKLEGGFGSEQMQQVKVGQELVFSGPWGKWKPLAEPLAGAIWVIATDTGITAALGLLASAAMAPLRERTHLLWLDAAEDEFLSHGFVADALPAGLGSFSSLAVAAVNDPKRMDLAATVLGAWHESSWPSAAYLVGDGQVTALLTEALVARGVDPQLVFSEHFFNKPAKI